LGRPTKQMVQQRGELRKNQELMLLRKQAAERLLRKGLQLLEETRTTEARQCLKQAEEMFQSLGLAPAKEEEEKKKEKQIQKQEEMKGRLEELFGRKFEDEELNGWTKEEENTGLFEQTVPVSEMPRPWEHPDLVATDEKKEEVEEFVGDEKVRKRIRRRLGLRGEKRLRPKRKQ